MRPWAVAIAVALVVPAAATAHAEPTSPQIRTKLERTAEKLHRAEVQESAIADDLDLLQRKIDATEVERKTVQVQVSAYARAAYMNGHGTDPMVVLITGTQASDSLGKVARLDQAGRQARLTIARAAALHRELRITRAAITQRQEQLSAVRSQLATDGAELTSLFSQVSAREVATEAKLVAEASRLRSARLASERALLASKRFKLQRASRLRRAVTEAKSNEEAKAAAQAAAAADAADDSDSEEADPEPEPKPEPDPKPEPEPKPDPKPEPEADPEPDEDRGNGNGSACAVGPANTFRNTWGDRRSGGRRHKGTDIFAPHGSPVYAVVGGVISGTRSGGLGGKSLLLRGDDGDTYYYAHNSSHSVGVGERVRAGERIGSVGATGNAAGGAAHVHFEKWPGGGRPRNPYPFLRQVCG